MATRRYLIGRGTKADIQIDDPSVSRIHAELKEDAGRFTLTDQGSSGGVWVRDGRGWRQMQKGHVVLDQPIRLSQFETTVGQLLGANSRDGRDVGSEGNPRRPRVYRDPETGEIVKESE